MFADVGIFYQYHRVIQAVRRYTNYLSESSPEMYKKNQQAITTLRKRQFGPTFHFTLFSVVVFGLIAGNVIPWTWEWFFIPTAGFETIAAVAQEFFFTKRRHHHNQTPKIENSPSADGGLRSVRAHQHLIANTSSSAASGLLHASSATLIVKQASTATTNPGSMVVSNIERET